MMMRQLIQRRDESGRVGRLCIRFLLTRVGAGLLVALAILFALPHQEEAQAQAVPPAISTDVPPRIFQSPGDPDHFKQSDWIRVFVTFTQDVTVTGSPSIGLDIGGVRRDAGYSYAAGPYVIFLYQVGDDDSDGDGVDIIANSMQLGGGSITGTGDGAAAVLSHLSQLDTDTRRPVDGIAPTAMLFGNRSGYEHPDNLVSVGVQFSEPVTGLTIDDFTVTHGTAVDLEEEFTPEPGNAYSFVITHAGEGIVTVKLPGGKVLDAAGNGNNVSSVLRIVVADPARVTITPGTSSTVEGEPVVFTLHRSKDNGARTVQLEVSQNGDFLSGTTSFGATFSTTPAAVSVEFPAGVLTKTISLDTEDDYPDEAEGSVTVTVLRDPTDFGYAAGTPHMATASVLDNDEAPDLYVSQTPTIPVLFASTNEVQEGAGIRFILVRTHDAGPQSLDVEISQQGDFLAAGHPGGLVIPADGRMQLTFPAGVLSTSLYLRTVDDSVIEDDGTVTLTVLPRPSDSLYPVLVQGTKTMTVRDDDALPTVTVSADVASVREGSELTFTLNRTKAPGEHVRWMPVWLEISDPLGILPPGTSLNQFLVIPGGRTKQEFSLQIIDDEVAEFDTNITVTVLPPNQTSDAPYLVGAPDSATIEVVDDEDPIVSVSAVASTVTEGSDAQFRFSRVGSAKSSLTVDVNIFGHYKIMSRATRRLVENLGPFPDTTVILDVGMTEAILSLTTEADQVNEGDGQVRVSIKGNIKYEVDGNGSAELLVEDDDIPEVTLRWISPTMTLQDNVWVGTMIEGEPIDWSVDCSGNTAAPEFGSSRIPFRLVRDMDHPLAVFSHYDVDFKSRHPCAGDVNAHLFLAGIKDGRKLYTGPDNGEIRFDLFPQELRYGESLNSYCYLDALPGTVKNVRFCPKFTLGAATSARIVVRNRNPTVVVEALDEDVHEGEPARFKLTRIWAADQINPEPLLDLTTTFDFTVRAAGSYVTAVPIDQRSFSNGVTEMIVEIPTLDNDLPGADGSVTLEILPGLPETQAGNIGGSYEVFDFLAGVTPQGKNSRFATVRILDNDEFQRLTIADGSAIEGSPVVFVVTLTGAHESPVSVDWSFRDGTALGGSDFVNTTGTFTLAAGETRKELSIATVPDSRQERTETFTLILSNPVEVLFRGDAATIQATGTIMDNDKPIVKVVPLSPRYVNEGGVVEFEIIREGLYDDPIDIEFTVTIGGSSPINLGRHLDNDIISSSVAFLSLDDSHFGPDFDYVATITPSSDYIVGSPGTATITLLDNDAVRELTLARQGTQSFSSASETLSFQYTVNNTGNVPTQGPITIHDSVLGEITCSTQSLAANASVVCTDSYTTTAADNDAGIVFSSAYASDGLTRSGEINFFVTKSGVPYYSLAPSTQVASETVGDSTAPLQIVRQGALSEETSISYRTVDVTALGGLDYEEIEGEVTFLANEYLKVISVTISDDTLDENEEQFAVVLSPTDDPDSIWSRATVSILDNDALLTFSIGVTEPEDEASGYAEVTVELQDANGVVSAPGRAVTVQYETQDGTATADEDYRALSGELVFEIGEQEKTLRVPIIDDVTDEPSETFDIVFKSPRHANLSSDPESHTILIVDNDDASTSITLSIDPTEVPEGAGTTEITVTAEMNADATTVATEVSVVVTGDTASEGSDFIAVPEFLLTIPARQVSATATFTFTPVDDAVVENVLESVTVAGNEVTQSFTVASAGGLFALMIRDDDRRGVYISPTEMALDEGGNENYTVALTSQPTGTVTVNPTLPVGAGISLAYSTLTFNANNWARPRNVTVIARPDVDAADEQVTISHSVTGADYGSVDGSSVTVSVTDDETPSTEIALRASLVSVTEGGGDQSIAITADFDESPPKVDTTVRVVVRGTSASSNDDFAAIAPFDMLISGGSTSATANITLSPVNDDVDEDDETLSITGRVAVDGVPVNGALPVTGITITIVDDDSRGVVVNPTALTMEEGDAQSYTIRLTSAPSVSSLITITVPANADLRVSPLGLFFHSDSWNVAQTVRVTSLSDADALDDTVVLTHSFIGSGSDYDGTAVDDVSVTITEPTSAAMSVEDVRGAEGLASLEFVVTLDQAISTTATVQYRTVGMTGNNGVTANPGTDYTNTSGTLTFAPGETRKTVLVSLGDDTQNEAEEYFQLVLENPTNAELPQPTPTNRTVQGIIEDDDPLPVVSVVGSAADGWSYVNETGGSLSYTVRLGEASGREVTVDYATVDRTPAARSLSLNTATAIADYVPESGTLTFLPGETAKYLTVAVNDDDISENDEVFALELSNPQNAVLSNRGWGVIRDEDVRGLVLTPPTLNLDEDSSKTYQVALLSQPTAAVTVTLTPSVGANLDLSSLSFQENDWSVAQTVTVTATNDADAEDRSATITHSAEGADYAGVTKELFVTIRDDETQGVLVSSTMLTVPEGGNETYTIVLTSQPSGPVTVTPSTSGNPDVTVSPSPLTFTAENWFIEQTVTVSVAHDADAANDIETVSHEVSGADYETETADDVAITVLDDETASTDVVLSVNPEAVAEDAAAQIITVTATLDHAPRLINTAVTVTVGEAADDATEGTDYETIESRFLYIVAGATSGTAAFTLTPIDNFVDEAHEALTVGGSAQGLTVTPSSVTIEDNDERGVVVSATSLTVPEGGSSTYSVVLQSQPAGNVTVTVNDPTDNTDVTSDPASLTFTNQNWDTAQTVTVMTVHDVDGDDDTATITHTVASTADSAYAGISTADVTVTVDDDETASTEVILTVDPEWADERTALTNVRLTAELNGAPRSVFTIVTVTVGAPGDSAVEGTDYQTIGEVTLNIRAGMTSTYYTIQFRPVNDRDEEGDEGISITGTTTVTGLTVTGTELILLDDETTRNVTLTAIPDSVAEDGGLRTVTVLATIGAGSYRVDTPLTVEVGVPVDSATAGTDYASVEDFTLTFLEGETSAMSTFQLDPTNDSFGEGDEKISISGSSTIGRAVVQGTEVTIIDDETLSTEISLSVTPDNLGEGASATTLTVTGTLNNDPRSSLTSVTVSIGASNDVAVAGADYETVNDFTLTIDAGQTTGSTTFQLIPTDDAIDEVDEALTVSGTTDATGLVVTTTSVTITDDDNDGVTVNPTEVTVTEGGTVTYTVVLDTEPAGNVTVTVNDPTDNTDVTADPATLTFTDQNWNVAQTVTVSAAQDGDAADETATVTHTVASTADADYQGISTADVAVTLEDDAPETVTVSYEQGVYTVAESDDSSTTEVEENKATVKVKLSADPERTVTIPVNKVPQGGATSADYSGVPTSVTFESGDTEETFDFTATQDTVDDDGESVKLTFGNLPTGVTEGTTNETVVSITDDDVPAVTVSYEQGAYTVAEGSSTSVKVKLSADPERTVTIPVNKVPQGGATTADYSGVPTSVTFNSGATEVNIPFAAASDSVDDDGESVKLTFGTLPTGVSEGTTKETVVSITDDDVPAVTVSYEQGTYTVAESDDSSTTEVEEHKATVKVKLSADPERTVTIPVNKVPQGGATSADYSGVPTSVTFESGDTEKTFTFTATADTVDDDGESVKLTFGTLPTGVTEGTTNETVVSIIDDDVPAVTVSYEQGAYTVAEGSSTSVKVKLSADPERQVVVIITKAEEDGASPGDYSGVPTSVTFNSGDTEKTFDFTATQDTVDDDGESVKLTFGSLPTGVTEGTTKETVVSITDDDVPAVTVSFEQGAYTVAESDDSSTTEVEEHKATVKVKLSVAPERTVTIPVNKAEQDGATSADYSGVPEDITFESGDTEKTFTFTATADTVDDDGESVKLTFGTLPTGVTEGTTKETVVSITDDDVPAVTVSFEQATYAVAEGSSITVKVKLDVAPERTVTVPINRAPQGGATTADYSGVPTSVTFNSGDTEVDIPFAAASDSVDDDGESVKLTFGSLPTGVTEGTTKETVVSIIDDDVPAVTVSYEQGAYTVAEGSSTSVKVKLSADPERTVTVPINKVPQGGATTADYSGVPTSVTFNGGATEVNIPFAAASDSVDDDGESVKLTFGTLPTGVTEGTTKETVVSIIDDDVPAVTVSYEQGAYTVAEGSSTSVKVKLSADPERTVTVPINKVPQGGATTADYSGVPTSVTFNGGDTEVNIPFAAASDSVDDDGESVKLTFGTLPTGVTEGTTKETVVSITDDDVPAVTVSYEQGAYTVAESDDSSTTEVEEHKVTIKVKLSADPERTVTIPVNKAPQGGATSADYSGVPEDITFEAGDTEKTFTFTATADTVDDDGESVKLTFGNLPAGVTEGTTKETVVSITDDDVPAVTVSFEQGAYTVAESDDSSTTEVEEHKVTIKVKLSADPERTVTIPVNKAPQGGATSADYSGVPEDITFEAGDTEKTFTFTATADTVDDDGESVKLTFGNLPTGVTEGTTKETVVSITDDDVPAVTVSFEQGAYTVAEGSSTSVKVKLSADPERQVVVIITKAEEDGASPGDYSGVPTSVTFNSGDTEKTFDFTATQDTVDDDGESVKLTFGNLPTGVTEGTTNETVVSITDDDVPAVTVSYEQGAYTVAEGSSTSVKVKLSADPERQVVVIITKAEEDGASPGDYSGVPTSVTFNSGDTEKTFDFTATQDTVDDDGESVKLTFGSLPTGVTEGTTKETVVSITDDDVPAVTVSFEQGAYTVAESDDSSTTEVEEHKATVKVKLSVAPERTVTIPVNKVPQGGATSADYSGVPISVTFEAGDTEKTFTFTATADTVDDDGESVKLTFGNLPAGVTEGTTKETVVSITDDDVPAVTVSFEQGAYTVAESDDSSTTEVEEHKVTIKVKLSADPERTVTIPVNKVPQGGATSADYSGVPTSVTFESGDTEKTFTFTATADTVDDDGESVKLTFGTLPTGVTEGTTKETVVSIIDDDVPAVTVSFEQATYAVAEGSSITVKVKLDVAPERTVTVPINKAPQGGATTADYSGVPTSVTFNSGDTEVNIPFAAASDSVDDDGESVKLTFGTLPTGVTEGTTKETVVSITDDDVPAVTVSYEQATYTVAEGSSITVKVKLDVAPERTVTVPINKVPQGGATTADYSGVPTSVTFNSGDTEVDIPFAAASDSVNDDGESVKLTFGSLPTGVTEGTTKETVVSIIDDDVPAVTVSYEQGAYTVAEGSSITVKVKLDVAPERTVTVPINKVPQGGATTADYSGVPTSVTFNGGATEVNIPFAAASDSVDDDGESVKLTFGNLPTGVTEGTTNETVVSITDDDVPAVTVSYEQATYTVAEGSSITVKVKLDVAPERTVTVPINKVPQGGATTADYSGVPTSVTFNSGDTEVDIPFAAASDSVDDDGESVKLTFGSLPTGVTEGTTKETVVSIIDDDVPAVTVSYEQGAYTVAESDDSSTTEVEEHKVTIKVKLSADPERTVTVPINKVPQGGATTADYSGVPEDITFEAGDTEKTFTFTATADTVDDDGESVKLTFGNLPTGVTEGTTKETVVSITDDDVPAVTVSFEQGAYTVAESDDSSTTEVEEHKVTIKVKLSADPERTVTIPVNKAPQGGATSADYSGVPEDITFEAGDTEKTFTFTATADTVDDDGESVKLTFGNLPTGVTEGTTKETVVSITDDDVPAVTVSFEQGAYTVAESDDSSTTEVEEHKVTIKVKLSADPERTVTIPVNKAEQGGATSADYSGVPEDITFEAGDTEKTFTFTATADTVDDDGESVKLTFGTLPTGVTEGTTKETVVSITDDDVPAVTVSYEQGAYTVAEGSSTSVKVKLSADPERTVTVPINKAPQGGATTADYSGVPTSVTFNSGDTEVDIPFAAASDSVDDDGESVKLTFGTLPTGVTEGTTKETVVSITDDDVPAVTVSYEQGAYTVAEGSSTSVKVKLSADPERTVTVPINKVPQGGATTADYSGVPTSVTFNSGDTEVDIPFAAASDSVDDDGESVKLTFGTLPTGVTEGTTKETVVSITDDDVPAVTVSYEQGAYTVAEGSSTSVKVKLSADPERQVVVIITKAEEDGASPGDYSGVPTSVTFNSGDTEKTFDFTATQDTVDDDGESVKLTFGNLPTGVTEGTTNETVVSITDDDVPAVTVSYEQGAYTVAEGSSTSVKVKLSADPERQVVVIITKAEEDGASPGDYSGVPTSVTFNSGDTEKTFDFTATQDTVDDDGESVKLTFGSLPTGVTEGTTKETVVSITDDDVPAVTVSFEQGAYTVAESDDSSTTEVEEHKATVKVKLSVAPERTVTIPVNKVPQGGATSADYSGVPISVTFEAGDTEKTFTFTATADTVDDDGESVKLTFGNLPAGVTEGTTKETVVSITDDDVPAVTVSFEQGAYTVAESGSRGAQGHQVKLSAVSGR